MTFKDKLLRFKNVALVSLASSRYNEDSMTATELVSQTAKKVRECMQITAEQCDIVSALIDSMTEYNEEQKEINISIKTKLENIKSESINCFTSLYHEDALTVLELAGRTAQQTNECVRLVNMMTDTLMELLDNIGLSYDETNKEITIKTGGVN